MIDDTDLDFNNDYKKGYQIQEDDYAVIYNGDKLFLKKKRLLRIKDIDNEKIGKIVYICRFDDKNVFLIEGDFANEEIYYKKGREIRKELFKEELWISGVVLQMKNWYDTNKFCGKCGNEMLEKDEERALICDSCKNVVYPKISPAIIVAIQDKDKILLANNVLWSKDMYSLVAGYVEIGESIEDAVIREVKEEVGLDIKNVRYYKSQPWPFSSSMMLGFVAEADINQELKLQETEINDAKWFGRENLPAHNPKISIAGEMIDRFKRYGKI